MRKLFCLASGAVLFALVGCTHDTPDANAPPRPASDTMESQTNDMGQPFPSSPKVHTAPPTEQVVPDKGDCSPSALGPSNGMPGGKPCGHEDATPEPNDNPMPKKQAPIAPSAP